MYLGATARRKVVREHAVRDPLLRPGHNPLVAIAHRDCLQPCDVTPGKRLTDCKAEELLSRKDVWENSCLQLGRAEV